MAVHGGLSLSYESPHHAQSGRCKRDSLLPKHHLRRLSRVGAMHGRELRVGAVERDRGRAFERAEHLPLPICCGNDKRPALDFDPSGGEVNHRGCVDDQHSLDNHASEDGRVDVQNHLLPRRDPHIVAFRRDAVGPDHWLQDLEFEVSRRNFDSLELVERIRWVCGCVFPCAWRGPRGKIFLRESARRQRRRPASSLRARVDLHRVAGPTCSIVSHAFNPRKARLFPHKAR
eukprot:2433660-Rhodomonas_salina.3